MKLEIYDEEKITQEPVRLKLMQSGSGDGVIVVAVNEDGNRILNGALIEFTCQGKIYRRGSINNKLGFQLDDESRIEETL